jgi:hypothetical protein
LGVVADDEELFKEAFSKLDSVISI